MIDLYDLLAVCADVFVEYARVRNGTYMQDGGKTNDKATEKAKNKTEKKTEKTDRHLFGCAGRDAAGRHPFVYGG